MTTMLLAQPKKQRLVTERDSLTIEQVKILTIGFLEAKELKVQKGILEDLIRNLESQISVLEDNDAEKKALYEGQISNLLEQKAQYNLQLEAYEKLLKKEKRKRFWSVFGGGLTTAAITYLYITK